jgi:hypothetical protein
MNSAVEHIVQELRSLSTEDLRLVHGLVEKMVSGASGEPETYGGPLTDEDITAAARVTFAALDADESKA